MSEIRKIFSLILVCGAMTALYGQIGLALNLNRANYMLFEKIYACVTIRNDSGRPLLFGANPALQGFILFDIRDESGRPLPMRKNVDLSFTGLYIGAGEIKRLVIPLSRYYALDRNGTYRVHVYISHNALQNEFRSSEVRFQVSDGVVIWKKEVGIPDIDGTGKVPEGSRTYAIRQLSDGLTRCYYLWVEDAGKIFGVTRIGTAVGYEKFQVEVDMLSRIHLLMPVAPRVYHYMAFNFEGSNLASTYWKNSDTIPMLYRNPKTGVVTRIGGIAARKGIDYQDPKGGNITASELLAEESGKVPDAPKNRGVLDLGAGIKTGPSRDDDEE